MASNEKSPTPPMHMNPLCRIWQLPPNGESIVCSISRKSRYFVVTTNDDLHDRDRVIWMSSEIMPHGIKLSTPHNETDAYVVEITQFSNEGRKHDERHCSSSLNITTDVGTKLLFQNEYVNVWDFHIPPGQRSHLHSHIHNYVFINLVWSKTRGIDKDGTYMGPPSIQEAGQVTFVQISGETIHAAENVCKEEFRQIIVEIKKQPNQEATG